MTRDDLIKLVAGAVVTVIMTLGWRTLDRVEKGVSAVQEKQAEHSEKLSALGATAAVGADLPARVRELERQVAVLEAARGRR